MSAPELRRSAVSPRLTWKAAAARADLERSRFSYLHWEGPALERPLVGDDDAFARAPSNGPTQAAFCPPANLDPCNFPILDEMRVCAP